MIFNEVFQWEQVSEGFWIVPVLCASKRTNFPWNLAVSLHRRMGLGTVRYEIISKIVPWVQQNSFPEKHFSSSEMNSADTTYNSNYLKPCKFHLNIQLKRRMFRASLTAYSRRFYVFGPSLPLSSIQAVFKDKACHITWIPVRDMRGNCWPVVVFHVTFA